LLPILCPDKDGTEQIRNKERDGVDNAQDVAHGGACIIDLCPVLLHYLNLNSHLVNRLAVRPLKESEVQQKDEQRDPSESHPSRLGVVATLA